MAKRKRKAIPAGSEDALAGQLGQWEALRRLWAYLWELRLALGAGLVLTLIWSAVGIGFGGLAKIFFDTIEKAKGSGSLEALNVTTALAIGAMAGKGVIFFMQNFCWAYISSHLTYRLRNEVYKHLQSQSMSFFDHRKTGQLLAGLSNDVPQVTNVLDAIQDIISAPFILVGGTIVLFWLNWKLALVSMICLPPTAMLIVWATRKVQAYTAQLQANRAQVLDIAEETISGIRVVKAFANEKHEIQRFLRQSRDVMRSIMRTVRVKATLRPMVEFLGGGAIIMVLWVGGQQMIHDPNSLTFGGLVWFVMVLQQVADAARNMGNISVNLATAGVAADRVFTLIDQKSEIVEKPEAVELGRVEGRVTLDRVRFAYRSGIPVLDGISFTMEPGEVVALVGPTGSGKTTIASLVPRFYDVVEGAVKVDGIDVRDCSVESLRKQIGIVPQETVLFAGTLRENIRYGRLDAHDEEIVEAAKTANAWEFIERFPDGLDTLVGERGARLSGGQKQRIAIARAVLRNPRILILDEATSSLDAQSEALVQDALQKLVKDRTTLVIAHRLSTIRNADKIVVLKEGRIVEVGNHSQLMAGRGVYSKLYQTQFRDLDELPAPEDLTLVTG